MKCETDAFIYAGFKIYKYINLFATTFSLISPALEFDSLFVSRNPWFCLSKCDIPLHFMALIGWSNTKNRCPNVNLFVSVFITLMKNVRFIAGYMLIINLILNDAKIKSTNIYIYIFKNVFCSHQRVRGIQ